MPHPYQVREVRLIIDRCINTIHIYLFYLHVHHPKCKLHFVEGKAITKTRGTKEFSQAASYAYKALAPSEKEKLRGKCCDHMQPLTAKIIEKNGHKIFKNIDIQVYIARKLLY